MNFPLMKRGSNMLKNAFKWTKNVLRVVELAFNLAVPVSQQATVINQVTNGAFRGEAFAPNAVIGILIDVL